MSTFIRVFFERQPQTIDLAKCDNQRLRMLAGQLHSDIASTKARLQEQGNSLEWEEKARKALMFMESNVRCVEQEQERRKQRADDDKARQVREARKSNIESAFFEVAKELLPAELFTRLHGQAQARAAKGGA